MERFWPGRRVPVVTESNREVLLMIMQFLGEGMFKESLHKLEQESGLFFDVKYFEDRVEAGDWEEVERYLSGFVHVNHNEESRTMFFEIRKQKYLETLDSQDRSKAFQILEKELKECTSEDQFGEISHLLTIKIFRQNEKLSNYGDVTSQRKALINILRRHIERNPLLHNKLKLPVLEPSSLRKMIQRHKIQREPHKNSNPSPHARLCSAQPDEAPRSSATHSANVYSADDLPRTVVNRLGQAGSVVTSMDFHPRQQNILLVGLMSGNVIIWDVYTGIRIYDIPFKVWDISALSMQFQTIMEGRNILSVNRCAWSPDGFKLGVAFSTHIVQIYGHVSNRRLGPRFEIEAHVGGVNDIVFVNPTMKPSILTCGDDKTIKIWDAESGVKYHTFDGHEAPAFYSISADGKMKSWRYDSFQLGANCDIPGVIYRRFVRSADETRIFGVLTSEQGASQLVELSLRGVIKRTYLDCTNALEQNGLSFETIRNRFLAVGNKGQIKFWDMDNENMLSCTVLPDYQQNSTPQVRVNKAGSLLSATILEGGFIILANADEQSKFKTRKSKRKVDHDLSKQGNGQTTVESGEGQTPQNDEVLPSKPSSFAQPSV